MLVPIPLNFDVPVYGNKESFPSYYATPEQTIEGMNGPLIVLNNRYIRPMKRASQGRYMRTRNAWQGWQTLAHEYTHHFGHHHPGFSSEKFDSLALKNLNDLLTQAKVPREYKKWVLRRVKRDYKQTTYIHTPAELGR